MNRGVCCACRCVCNSESLAFITWSVSFTFLEMLKTWNGGESKPGAGD